MNRKLLISVGILILVAVLLVWVYLMLFGRPTTPGQVFTNLGFQPVIQDTTVTQNIDDNPDLESLVDTSSANLNQLTTRPVAGFTERIASSSASVRYVERGTGHVYDIDLASGAETRVSPTTIPQVSEAVFSPSGNRVALTSYQDYSASVFVGTLEGGSLRGSTLPIGSTNLHWKNNTVLQYTASANGNTSAYELDTDTLETVTLFAFPFAEFTMWWGTEAEAPIALTKPSASLRSYGYTFTENSTVSPALPKLYGLTGFREAGRQILTYYTGEGYTSTYFAPDTNTYTPQPILMLREKCVFDIFITDYVWCGAPATTPTGLFVEDWYKGTTRSDDFLWLVNVDRQTAELVASPENISGRSVDVTHMQIGSEGTDLYFINKPDRTLWRYTLDTDEST